MRIEILNTGTELLLGNTLNTHGAWFGRELFKLGLRVARQTTVPDGAAIREAIRECVGRADVLIVTGGWGPTSDDLTREIAAAVLGLELIGMRRRCVRWRRFSRGATGRWRRPTASRRCFRWARTCCPTRTAPRRGSMCRRA